MTTATDQSFPPPWFNIAKYRAAKGFSALEWYEQLTRRQSLLMHYTLGAKVGDAYEDQIWRLHTARAAASMRSDPLERVPVSGLAAPESQPIYDVCVSDLMKQADRDRQARKYDLCDRSKPQRWRVIRNPQATFDQHSDLAQERVTLDYYDIRKPPRAVIQVDLGATDTALRAAFNQWLAQARGASTEGNGVTPESPADLAQVANSLSNSQKPAYDRWAKYQILPYLDLAIWAMEVNVDVTWPMYADALCDGHYRTHDDIRKTTHKKWAVPLMQDLSKLKAAVGYEQ
ncbi:hypothetical protein M2401_005015 [Pseudomonas sp. JUb42]|uniref:DUF6387 family protein n=1 Tax=Pseudomonas sp. JUb42 TaxID=2940611 RepID=UPI00216A821F|nr:DUF6387 family protein [Pseudomonas sp. JUb42]MCS3471253.1 hypothetical protein [Pseudomonas sp. JUb42]